MTRTTETGLEIGERLRAAWGHRPPDLLLRGATVLLPSGEWARRDVGVVGSRIAVVAEGLSAPGEATIELAGKTIVPGYVEPHCHALGPLSIGSYCGAVLARGVSCAVTDDAFAYGFLPAQSYPALLDVSTRLPLVLRWSLRLDRPRSVPYSVLAELLEREDVGQLGEVSTRPALSEPDPEALELVAAARARGLRVEGHSPGASASTLGAGAAGGLSADHEGRRGEEVLERLRAGMWAFLRHTDDLRDVRPIVAEMLAAGVSFERTGFTSDWSLPPWIAAAGTIDAAIAEALAAGLPSAEAYACVTRRPAAYEGLDAHFGSVAPGRLACLNVLADRESPTPERVFSLGREAARDGELLVAVPEVEWERLGAPPWTRRAAGPAAAAYRLGPEEPEIHFESVSMVRPGPGPGGESVTAVALDQAAGTITLARAFGSPARVDAVASTLTPQRILVGLGADERALARCVEAVVAVGGGVALLDGGNLSVLPLPRGGAISDASFATVERQWSQIGAAWAAAGGDHHPAITLLHLASTALPGARFAAEGLLETRSGKLLAPARPVLWP